MEAGVDVTTVSRVTKALGTAADPGAVKSRQGE